MSLPQKKFGLLRLVYKALTRKPDSLEKFTPFSIKVLNYYPQRNYIEGFEKKFGNPDRLPTFAFNAAFPIVMQCLVQSSIPSKLAGLIHLTSEFDYLSKHNWRLPCDVEVGIVSAEESEQGTLYLFETKIYQFKKLTIINTNTMLAKKRGYKPSSSSATKQNLPLEKVLHRFDITLKDAVKYAFASGDFNPIHLNHWLAKKLGMEKALIHGMYNVHNVASYLKDETQWTGKYLKANFNKPCFLPASVCLKEYDEEGQLGLFNSAGTRRFVKFQTLKKEA